MDFKPDKQSGVDIPYFEDTNAKITPNYTSTKTVEQAIAQLNDEMIKLDGILQSVQSGRFNMNALVRVGYVIRFTLNGSPGMIRVAGLPMRSPTEAKEKQVRVQALLTVVAMLTSARVARIFNPDAHPLVPYLLVADNKTVAQAFEEKRLLLTGGE